jgi:hypothetical protein
MVHYNYLVLFSTLCCPLDAGFRLWENVVGELELLPGQKFSKRKWRKPCNSTFKRTQQNISQRWSHVRLYGPLHVFHLPGTYQQILYSMEEGTLKTPTPKCRLYWSLFWGWWSNFVGSESVKKQSEKLLQNMVYNTTQHPPPPHSHTVCSVYTVVWEVGGGGSERR